MKPRPKPKYLQAEHGGQRERWLISYTDFVTILLILFVAIAAQSLHSVPLTPRAAPTSYQNLANQNPRPSPGHTNHRRDHSRTDGVP